MQLLAGFKFSEVTHSHSSLLFLCLLDVTCEHTHMHLVLIWQTVDGGYITMTTDTTPTKVEAWHATTLTPKRYDTAIMEH